MPASRRAVLTAALAAGAVVGGRPPEARPSAPNRPPRPDIRPRSAWAKDLPPTGTLTAENADDVRFLMIHHTATPNGDAPGDTAGRLRGVYRHHTGQKQWHDVAYNFFVDRHGRIWEGRAGSVARPVKGDATGGSQGYALLCCFVGDHSKQPPSKAAMAAMASLVAWLAGRYDIDLAAGAKSEFVSRGSNRWPEGRRVRTDTLAAHRDMSLTACPGDALYPLVRSELRPRAHRLVQRAQQAKPASPSPSPSAPQPAPAPPAPTPEPLGDEAGVIGGVIALAGVAAGLLWVRGRRDRER